MEKERLKFCIERFDNYFDSINNKSAVFLALGTFIVGGLIASYPWLKLNVNCCFWLYFFLMLSIALGLTSIIIVIIATIPYMSEPSKSMLYFHSICSVDEKSFCKKSSEYTNEEEMSDLRIQVHRLASGLKKKYQRLKIAGMLYAIMFFCLIPLIILIITNLK